MRWKSLSCSRKVGNQNGKQPTGQRAGIYVRCRGVLLLFSADQ
jgi:hypothetical protein